MITLGALIETANFRLDALGIVGPLMGAALVLRSSNAVHLAGSNLLQVLTKPNGMTMTQTYEASRDLLTSMAYHRGSTLVAQREYTHDIFGRPTARNTARQGKIVHDIFSHNTRSELVGATVNNKEYEYSYDNIGNRLTSMEEAESTIYATNALNQYTSVHENSEDEFTPEYDADGNQTRVKTQTGIWEVIYNAENRPISFTNASSSTVVTCAYDSMGRRSSKKVSVNGIVSLYQRYLYRGYLQIASIDLTRSHHPCLWLITWDPSQTFATRPLAIQKDGTWFTYGWNLSKNICEVFKSNGTIGVAYVYSPYGHIWSEGSISQPVCWSSEMYDEELALTYFTHRFFNSSDGRWISHDIIGENDSLNLYAYVKNSPIMQIDSLGMLSLSVSGDIKDSALTSRRSISGVGWALDFQVKKLGYDVSIEWKKIKQQ